MVVEKDSSDQATTDSSIINDLIGEEEKMDELKARKEEKKVKRQEAKLRQRVAAQKKAANKGGKGRNNVSDNEDDEADVSMLVTKKSGLKK